MKYALHQALDGQGKSILHDFTVTLNNNSDNSQHLLSTQILSNTHLNQALPNFFCKGLDNKCFQLVGYLVLLQVLNFAVIVRKPKVICKERVWLCSNETLFSKTGRRLDVAHMTCLISYTY